MKKAIFILGAFAVIAACSQEVEMPLVKSTFTIHADAPQAPDGEGTKVSYSEGSETSGIHWEVGETIGLVNSDDNVESAALEDGNRTEGGNKADFSVNATAGTYTVYHPYHAETVNDAIRFEIPAVQNQGIMGFLDASIKRLPLIGKAPVTLEDPANSVNAEFNVVGTVLRFFIYGAEGEKIKKVSVSSASTLSGKISTTNAGVISETVADEGSSVTVVVTDEGYSIPKLAEDAKGAYAVVVPAAIAASNDGSVTYTVATNEFIYTFVSKEAHNWESGKKYDVYLNLANRTTLKPATPDSLYILGAATKVGWAPDKAISLKRTPGTDIFEEYVFLKHNEEFHFANHKKGGDYSHAYGYDDLTGKIGYSGSKFLDNFEHINNFKVTEGFGWYKVTVDFSTGEVALDHRPPYVVGTNNSPGWGHASSSRMSAVEGQPGVFKIDYIIFNRNKEDNYSCEFKFSANSTFDYDYVAESDGIDSYADYHNGLPMKMRIAGTDNAPEDYKWHLGLSDSGIGYEIILNTIDMTFTMTRKPVFYIMGESGENWAWHAWFNDKAKMTSDYTNKKSTWTGDLISNVGEGKTFKIYSEPVSGHTGYEKEYALWLFSSDSGTETIVALEDENTSYNVYKNIHDPDNKWRFKAAAGGKNVTLTLDWSDWDNITLSVKFNN